MPPSKLGRSRSQWPSHSAVKPLSGLIFPYVSSGRGLGVRIYLAVHPLFELERGYVSHLIYILLRPKLYAHYYICDRKFFVFYSTNTRQFLKYHSGFLRMRVAVEPSPLERVGIGEK
jgi:hypothetical protein